MAQEGESSFQKQLPPITMVPTAATHAPNVAYYPSQPPPYSPHGHHVPPPGHYVPQPGAPPMQATVIPMMIPPAVGSKPTHITCKACNLQIVSRVEFKPSMRTHMMALLLCIFGCWPCICVPYCMDTCNNIDHYCPNCGAYIGTHIN